jgi:hypothetical protein
MIEDTVGLVNALKHAEVSKLQVSRSLSLPLSFSTYM